jgi:hypothetical protein
MFFTGIAIVALVFRPTLWIPIAVISLIWSIGAIGTHNREVKKARAAAKRV